MDIKQLNYFVQIAQCGSYSLASQKLYISQPALSKVIKNMEDEMGFSLFYTYQRRQKLTDAGQLFYEKAVKLIESYNDLIQTTYVEECIDKGHLKIGLSVAAGGALFSHIIPAFTKLYPQITFSILERETNILKDELLHKNLDVAYVDTYHMNGPDDKENFEINELFQTENVLVVPVDNPLVGKSDLSYPDFKDEKLIFYNGGKEVSSQTEVEMKKMGVTPNITFVSTQWNFIFDAVSSGMGVTMCPYYIYSKHKNPQITCVKLKDDLAFRKIGIITKKGEYKTRACICFMEFATNLANYEGIVEKLRMPAETESESSAEAEEE